MDPPTVRAATFSERCMCCCVALAGVPDTPPPVPLCTCTRGCRLCREVWGRTKEAVWVGAFKPATLHPCFTHRFATMGGCIQTVNSSYARAVLTMSSESATQRTAGIEHDKDISTGDWCVCSADLPPVGAGVGFENATGAIGTQQGALLFCTSAPSHSLTAQRAHKDTATAYFGAATGQQRQNHDGRDDAGSHRGGGGEEAKSSGHWERVNVQRRPGKHPHAWCRQAA